MKIHVVFSLALAVTLNCGCDSSGNKIEGIFGEKLGHKIQGKSSCLREYGRDTLHEIDPISRFPMFISGEQHYYANVDADENITVLSFAVQNEDTKTLIAQVGEFLDAVEKKFGSFCIEEVDEDSERYFLVAGDGVISIRGCFPETYADALPIMKTTGYTFKVRCISRKRFVDEWARSRGEFTWLSIEPDTRFPSSLQEEMKDALKKYRDFL